MLPPSNRPSQILRKAGEYLEAGTALVWVLDTERRRATVYRADGTVAVLGEAGVLEGFALALSEAWE